MRPLKLFIGLVAALLSPAVSAGEPCYPNNTQVVDDLGPALEFASWSMPTLPDYSDLSDEELAQAVAALEQKAAALAPYADAYVQLMDRVAGANFTLWSKLADANARADSGHGFRPELFLLPYQNWDEQLSYNQKKLLQAALDELIRQMRQDIRAGQVSAPFDPGDIAHETTPQGIVAAMRLNQLLQQGQLPTDFEAHSPSSAEDVRALQALDDGVFPDVERHPAAFQSVLYATKDAPDGRFMEFAEARQVPLSAKGLPDTLPNGERIAELLDQLVRDQLALNQALEARGEQPASTPTLDAVVDGVAALDSNIGKFGKAFVDQLNGEYSFTDEHALVEVDGETRIAVVPKSLYRPSPVAGPGARGYESHTLDGRITIYPGNDYSPATPLSPEQLDELVRIKDSAELLEGNTTGLSIADVPMSPQLSGRLGLGYAAQQPAIPAPFNSSFMDVFQPRKAIKQRPEQIDRAALVPVEVRQDYLLSLGSKAFQRSLDERSNTELTAAMDNTWLNRTVEVLDVPGWIFKGDDPDSWIGPRAERNLWRSNRWGELVDERTEALTEDSIYGRYQPAMAGLREIYNINNQHEALNLRYAEQHKETEFATMMYVGMLPLSAFGLAETGVALARPVVARLGVRTTVSLADDVVRAADDLARVSDDVLKGLDDAARVADEFIEAGDDLARLTTGGLDELAEGGDDLARAADELAELSDEVAAAGDELVSAGDGIHYNARPQDKLYSSRGGDQQLHVDLAGDYDLQEATKKALGRISNGNTPEEKLAHLVDHVHNDVTYDMAAQQAKYLEANSMPAGQAKLGEMLQDGAVVCREKAVFTHQLLSEMGIESKVVIGNVTAHDGVYGHAWVQLADGTVIDGTWGRIYLGGKGYPVQQVLKTQVFSTPHKLMNPAQVEQAVTQAAGVLDSPKLLQRLQRQVAGAASLSPADALLTIGNRVKVPQTKGGVMGLFGGKKTGAITRVERDMVFVQLNGQEVKFTRNEILNLNNVPTAPTRPRPSWKGR